jgi:hypothetical protein
MAVGRLVTDSKSGAVNIDINPVLVGAVGEGGCGAGCCGVRGARVTRRGMKVLPWRYGIFVAPAFPGIAYRPVNAGGVRGEATSRLFRRQ